MNEYLCLSVRKGFTIKLTFLFFILKICSRCKHFELLRCRDFSSDMFTSLISGRERICGGGKNFFPFSSS